MWGTAAVEEEATWEGTGSGDNGGGGGGGTVAWRSLRVNQQARAMRQPAVTRPAE